MQHSPGPGKYNEIDPEVIKKRGEKWEIKKDKWMDVRSNQLPKLTEVSPTSYKADVSFKNTVDPKNNKFFNVGKAKEKCFVDKYVQQHSWVPAPSAYATNLDKAYDKRSRSPLAQRGKRQ